MKIGYYKLVDKKPVSCSVDEFSALFEKRENRNVGSYVHPKTETAVSTVFLGIDHGFFGAPLFFETMIFSEEPKLDGKMERYETFEEAEKGHEKFVKLVKKYFLNKKVKK